jgi:hypothetical protein
MGGNLCQFLIKRGIIYPKHIKDKKKTCKKASSPIQ